MKTIIIDDEKHCREVLSMLLQKHCPHIELIGSFSSGTEALEQIEQLQPELVLLDIEMPGMSGFGFLSACNRRSFSVVFTTAYNEYAIQAIRHSALDYLLKPVDKDELKKAVERAGNEQAMRPEKRIAQLLQSMQQGSEHKRFAVPTMEGLILINPEEIMYIKSDGPYSHFYFADGRHLLISKTLREAEETLPTHLFFRIHNSYMVNMQYVQKYLRGEGGEVVMRNGLQLPVSRNRKQEFLNLLERI
jgi:two-component system LytT family response regulator